MTETERQLRPRLRAHGRQLGDRRNGRTREQEIDRLVNETAYEHRPRMLFARFLAVVATDVVHRHLLEPAEWRLVSDRGVMTSFIVTPLE